MPSTPAAITKQEIGKCAREYGKTNSKPYLGYDLGELVYETFVGTRNKTTGLYEGEHRFIARSGEGCEGCDFNKLPGVPKK